MRWWKILGLAGLIGGVALGVTVGGCAKIEARDLTGPRLIVLHVTLEGRAANGEAPASCG